MAVILLMVYPGGKCFNIFTAEIPSRQAATKKSGACLEITNYKIQITNKEVPFGQIDACGEKREARKLGR